MDRINVIAVNATSAVRGWFLVVTCRVNIIRREAMGTASVRKLINT